MIDMDKFYFLHVIAIITSLIFTPIIKKIAVKINAIDVPKDNRRIHKKPIPLLGGAAIYISFIIGVFIKKGDITTEELAIILGATIILFGGILDDIKDIRPMQKLTIQFIASLCLILMGVKIQLITNPFSDTMPFFNIGLFSTPITILWVIGVTNAINLIDGLDGLAAGVSLISTLTILFISILLQRNTTAFLTAILSGAILGFLPYNFNPASIFMGDTGAQLLGFLLAAISIKGAIKSAATFTIVVPIIILGVPIFDTLFAMIRRKLNGKPIMQGDRGHLHHRLLDMGLSQKKTVLIMYGISAVLGMIAIIAVQINNLNSYFLLGIVIILVVILSWKFDFFKHKD
jgi:UDP-GlcNAc:undecaprenyl-phosphate/decaprenyl-phosphate GlcNAc-1-phosphate transferase